MPAPVGKSTDPTEMIDTLLSIARRATAMIEDLSNRNEELVAAADGLTPDGDSLESQIAALQNENAALREHCYVMRGLVTNAKASSAYGTIKFMRACLKDIP